MQTHKPETDCFRSKRLKYVIKTLAWPVLGAGYYLFVRLTGHSVGCPFRALTGYCCPGCGITRMFLCLGRGRIREAFLSNPVIFCGLPFFGVIFLQSVTDALKGMPRRKRKYETGFLCVCAAVLAVYGILRNLA